jgi:DNA-binding transcriptional LysR family regulator
MARKAAQIPTRLTATRVRQLQLFSLLRDAGSVSQAARQADVSQPAATSMLKELEIGFGVQLFTRGPKGVELTRQGERVANRVARALRELQWAVMEGRSANLEQESLRVGFVPTMAFYGLLSAAARFREQQPEVLLSLKQMNVRDCAAALVQGDVDMILSLSDPSLHKVQGVDRIVSDMLFDDTHGAFASKALKLPKTKLDAGQLIAYPWILPTHESFLRHLIDDWFLQRGHGLPEVLTEITPVALALPLSRLMPCLTILPKRVSHLPEGAHLVPVLQDEFSIDLRLVFAARESTLQVRHSIRQFVACILKSKD